MKPVKKTKNVAAAEAGNGSIAAEVAIASKQTSQQTPSVNVEVVAKGHAVEEAIEIALEAASTAVDSALEIQRVRAEAHKLIAESRKSGRLLLFSAALVFTLSGIAVFGSLVYFKRAMNDLDLITKVNKDALLVFAGEINGVAAVAKTLDGNVRTSSKAIESIVATNTDLSGQVQRLTIALNAANANIARLEVQEKKFVEIRQSLDELSSATRSANARAAELRIAATRPPAPSTVSKPRPKSRTLASSRPQASPTPGAPTGNSMIRYP